MIDKHETNNKKDPQKNNPLGTVSKTTGWIKHVKAGHHRPASETPFEWHFVGWLIVALDRAELGIPS